MTLALPSVRLRRCLAAAAAVIAVLSGRHSQLFAQGLHVEVGHLLEQDGWTTFRVGIDRTIAWPVGMSLYGTHLRDASPVGRRLWGAGADLALLRGRRSGPYAIGGVAGGFSSDSLDDWWHSWSAGGGYQLVLGGAVVLAGEARWHTISPERRDGVELSIRLGALFGGSSRPGQRQSPEPAQATAPPPPTEIEHPETRAPPLATVAPAERPASAPAALADSVVATALEALGTNYRLGGTTTDGFDCSGLIQHAYGRHGIKLPRVSRDQAREGQAVQRSLDALRPGDILTFSQSGKRITHVGLYLGDARFIHSARRGVQVSLLSAKDAYGKWWWKRWVGARRIVNGRS
jgi:cell wall-associated NlpC family hydrolase